MRSLFQRVGENGAITLDKAMMDAIGLSANGEVHVRVSEGAIVVTPSGAQQIDPAKFTARLEDCITERRSLLQKLAQ